MRLAIVGSTGFANPDGLFQAADIILRKLEVRRPSLIVSGGAVGVDTLAAGIARALCFHVVEFLPTNPWWEPEGFKARNILIAENCDELIAIRCAASKTYGSGWTADYAEGLGKPVSRYLIKVAE